MIYSIIRFATFIGILGAAVWGLTLLNNSDGYIILGIGGKERPLSILTVVLLLAALLIVFWLLIELIRLCLTLLNFVAGDKNAFSKYFKARSNRKGLNALSNTVENLASGDAKGALSQAYKADKYLDKPALTGILLAQSAKAAGKTKEAEAAYKKVLESGTGRFAAVRGLMQQRIENGDEETALKLAEKAIALKPNDIETINALFELQVDAKQWDGARKTLKAKAKYEKLPSAFVSRREAVMAISEAQKIDKEAEPERYNDRVMLAHRLAPSLVPAAVLAAQVKAEAGNIRAADTILVKAWNAGPHPDIAKAYGALAPDETAEARLRRFKVLTKRQSANPETRMLKAELFLAAEDFPQARRALGNAATLGDTTRSLSIMAAIEHGEGADASVVRAYLARAASASRGAQWVCNDCGHVHSEWVSDCGSCGHFDTLDWKMPAEAADDQKGLGVLMPLLTAGTGAEDAQVVEDALIVDPIKNS